MIGDHQMLILVRFEDIGKLLAFGVSPIFTYLLSRFRTTFILKVTPSHDVTFFEYIPGFGTPTIFFAWS